MERNDSGRRRLDIVKARIVYDTITLCLADVMLRAQGLICNKGR